MLFANINVDADFIAQVCDLYLNSRMSGTQIANEIGVSNYKVYQVIKEQGIARSNSDKSKKYFCNSSYFDVIDDEHKAYWLGFIAADGYIRSKIKYNNRALGICLSAKDRGHLEKFKKDICASHPIIDFTEKHFKTDCSRIVIVDEQICNSLENHGVVEHKSLCLSFPSEEQVPTRYVNDYVRGYFDGDGCISVSKSETYTASLMGTYEFLMRIKEIYGLDEKLYRKKECKTNNYALRIGGSYRPYSFLRQLYDGATIYLDRKFQRYINLQDKVQK